MKFPINNFQVNYGSNAIESLHKSVKSVETETVVLRREADRRKPLSCSEKRKRNETLAIGLSKTDLLNTHTKDIGNEKEGGNVTEVKSNAVSDSYKGVNCSTKHSDTKTSKEENFIEIDQSVSKEEESEFTGPTKVISEESFNNSIDLQNNDKTDSIQHGVNERSESWDEQEHETKVKEEREEKSTEILTERADKEENSHFKEVVSGVIKSLAQNNSTETNELCEETNEETHSQSSSRVRTKEGTKICQVANGEEIENCQVVNKEETEICQVVKDHDQDKDEVITNQDEFQNSDAHLEEDILQNNINIDTKINLEEITQEDVTLESIENSEKACLGDNLDKEEEIIQDHCIFENIENSKNADMEDEKVLQTNLEINDRIKKEEKINNILPQTSSIEEKINTEGEIQEHNDKNTVDNLENAEIGQNMEKGEETTNELKTVVPETEKVDIPIKVNIQTISLGSVSEQEILEYNESEDIEKSDCDEEVDEE